MKKPKELDMQENTLRAKFKKKKGKKRKKTKFMNLLKQSCKQTSKSPQICKP